MANCSLTFKYLKADLYVNGSLVPQNIDENAQQAFEAMINKKLADFCVRINNDGGYISVNVSGFGKDFSDWKLITPSQTIFDEVKVFLSSK